MFHNINPPFSLLIGKPGDHAKFSNVVITPDPPVKGDDIEVKATVTLGKLFSEYSNFRYWCDLTADCICLVLEF